MEIDKNRIVVGSLILLFFISGYFIKFDYLILSTISLLVIFELYKSKFINNSFDYLILFFFIIMLPIIYFNYEFIIYLNFFLFFLIILNILIPGFYIKKVFLICVLIFIQNLFSIHYIDRNLLYFTIFVAFFNDTIAYVFGKMLKGPLIIPSISPNKTWSGTIVSFILSFFIIYQYNLSILISSLLSISLFFGDIFYSYNKRKNHLKDFSKILLNHGGILDRLDSMFFFTIILIFSIK